MSRYSNIIEIFGPKPTTLGVAALNINIENEEIYPPRMIQCLHSLIEEQSFRSPDALAVQYGEEQVTYLELNQRANRVAHYLRDSGVSAETLVGICLNRSIQMVVSILGVLKAGGAYLPLDPTYPQDRNALILEDAGVRFILTEKSLLNALPKTSARLVCVDQEATDIMARAAVNPKINTRPDHLAHLIYTSGSTGQPKGVMISHGNLILFVKNSNSALEVRSTDVYLQNAPIAYIVAVRQLMVPLSSGATIVLATDDEARDPLLLFQLIKRRRVTLMDVVPSFWRTCINRLFDLSPEERQELLDNSLRRIVSVGEPLYFNVPRNWRLDFGHKAVLVSNFGQTETTGVVSTYTIQPEEIGPNEGIVPIGPSISGARLYVLNENLKPVAPGEAGELYVSSACLAIGYWNKPDLTAKKFISNPFDDGISNQLYRTGDLARCRQDGVIEHLGRGDHQVKIRGQRLELGEVESAMHKFPNIQQCVVVAKGKSPDERYLAAFIIASETISVNELKTFMRSRVPEYMAPTVYQFLDSFPLTPNGKLDRLALQELPTPLETNPHESVVEQPRNDIEFRIAKIWKVLLNRAAIGIHDDFFDLGGHSFLAVRLFARIEEEFGVRLPLTTLFHAATIAQLGEVIHQQDESIVNWNPLVPICTGGAKPPFFGVHGHEGGVLFWKSLLEFLPGDQPFYGLQAQGVDGLQPTLKKIEEMAALYIHEIRKVQPRGPYYLGGYSLGGEIALELSQQLQRQGERVRLLVMFDTRNPKRRSNSMGEHQKSNLYTYWQRKITGHFRRLSVLSAREKISYITHDLFYRIERLWVYTLAGIFRILKRRLPDNLLLNYLRKSHTQALLAYSPQWYPGRITLFRASETLSQEPDNTPHGWHSLAGGGLEVFHFNATHNLLNIEYAKEVAPQLIACIDQAQNRG